MKHKKVTAEAIRKKTYKPRKDKIYDILCKYEESHKTWDLYEMADYINKRLR